MVTAPHWKNGVGFLIPMILLPIVIVVIIPASAQDADDKGGSTSASSLFIALFANGDALVEQNVDIVDPLAQEIRVKLYGDDIRDLFVVDYGDNAVNFNRGELPSEIVLNRPNASNLKISYTTSDFLSKDRREWIFHLNSTVSLSVKLPPKSILTDPGENPSIVLVGDQQLLTYKPGNIRFVYVIGSLGTQEQANIVIQAAQTTIVQMNNNYPGIVLKNAKDLIQRAIDARDNSRFTEAEGLADQANDAAIATGRDYASAQSALSNAETQINSATADGRALDKSAINQMLVQANNEFANGNYTKAINTAQDAIAALQDVSSPPEISTYLIIGVLATAGAAGGVGIIIFLRKRKHSNLFVPPTHESNNISKSDISNSDAKRSAEAISRSSHPTVSTDSRRDALGIAQDQENAESLEGTRIPPLPGASVSNSAIDSSLLLHIVGNILTERPHLRPEDQQVLKFLAEKEGAVFESEIRSQFQIPKTTVWRLVKRLEREELIEIRKAGGQNLIKLRYEDKQA
ncbi:MAG: hypothetical protein M3270_06975 [Thermoproteota archaeon]|nr:hypothetical protein [Thermoproteota archaeon]